MKTLCVGSLTLFVLTLLVHRAPPLDAQCELGKLSASDGSFGDAFGAFMATDGPLAVVGAPLDDDACPTVPNCDSGAVFVYRYLGGLWVEEQKLTAQDGYASAGDFFGAATSVSGNVIAVGVPRESSWGSVYIYRFDGSRWVEEQHLWASDGGPFEGFGTSVAVLDDVLVVGADRQGSGDRGAVYVFRYDGTHWIEEDKLTALASDRLGASVALTSDRIVAGAPESNGRAGAVFVYRYDGSSWVEEQELTASDADPPIPFAGDFFGTAIAVNGEVIVVGAPGDDDGCGGCPSTAFFCCDTGAAYVFRRRNDRWVEEQKLTASAPVWRHGFAAVSVRGDLVAVGAFGDDDHCNGCPPDDFCFCDSGAVYLFRWNGEKWIEAPKLTATDAHEADAFGFSVVLGERFAMVGSPRDEPAGTVYLLALAGTDCNANGEFDLCDIAAGVVTDDDSDFFPDDCGHFLRGDANGNGDVGGLSDAVFLVSYQFIPGSPVPPCLDAADVNDDGSISGLADGVYLLNFQFILGNPPPPAPGPIECGPDPTPDAVGCVAHPCG